MGGGRGGLTSARPPPCSTTPVQRCPTTRWCCTVAGGPTAAETPDAGEPAGLGCAVPPGQDRAVIGRLHHVVVDCPDPAALAGFYAELLGLPVTWQEDDFAVVARDDKSSGIGFQLAPGFQPPQWPDPSRPQQIHFDVMVDDVERRRAACAGAGCPAADGRGRRLTGICGPGWASFLPDTPSGLGGADRWRAGQGMTSRRNDPAYRQPPEGGFNPRGSWHLTAHCATRAGRSAGACAAWRPGMLAIIGAVIFAIAGISPPAGGVY